MTSIVNYMDEIKNIENAIDQIDDEHSNEENKSIRSRLSSMLHNLERTADEMASYINGYWNQSDIDYLKQSNAFNLLNKNYADYLTGLTQLQRLERVKYICVTQTYDEKMYFLEEYTKHKEEHEEVKIKRTR